MSKINEMIKELCPNGVEWVKLGEVCKTIKAPHKLKTSEYLEQGNYYVIDQGQEYHAGFTNNEEALLPFGEYVLYGDHTCIVKYVCERFAQGADGLKILSPISCNCKYLYYALCLYNLTNTEYKRHWTAAKDSLIPLPPLPIQREIVNILDKFSSLIDNLDETIKLRQKQYEYYRDHLFGKDIKELSKFTDHEINTVSHEQN